jgi:hypothetical protein
MGDHGADIGGQLQMSVARGSILFIADRFPCSTHIMNIARLPTARRQRVGRELQFIADAAIDFRELSERLIDLALDAWNLGFDEIFALQFSLNEQAMFGD